MKSIIPPAVAQWVIDNGFCIPLGTDKFYDVLSNQIHVRHGDRWVHATLEKPRKLPKDYVRKLKSTIHND